MKFLWQELQENRKNLREDFKDWNSKHNSHEWKPCASFLSVVTFSYTFHDG